MRLTSFLRNIRNKILGVNQAHARFDTLNQQLDGLAERLQAYEARIDTVSAPAEAAVRDIAVLQSGQAGLAGQVADLSSQCGALSAQLDDLSRRLGSESAALAERVHHDTMALFARNAALFRSHAPRAPGAPRDKTEVVEKIAFLVHSKELINHYGCVWDQLPPDSFAVVLHGSVAAASVSDFTRWKCDVVTSEAVLSSGRSYRYLVSNHPVSDHGEPLIQRLAQINIRFMYAAGKSGWNLSAWNSLYDVILCFGPYHAANFSHASDAVIVQMGYPRFDRYFNEPADPERLAKALGCDPSKKTVVWLPTQGAISSLGHFDEEIAALTSRYNVLVKMHPLTPLADPDKAAALKRLPFTQVIADASDNLPLYQVADYMLFDYGGPPMAGIYTDKRMVLLNVPGAADDALTGDDSPDIAIRRELVSVEPDAHAIARLLDDDATWQVQAPARRRLRSLYFAPHFGFSAQVAAQALTNLHRLVPHADEPAPGKENF